MKAFDLGTGFSVGDNKPLLVGDTTKLLLSRFPPLTLIVGFFIIDVGYDDKGLF
jgi:hypothetical protein